MNNGTVGNPSVSFKNNSSVGIYKNTSDQMVFVGVGSNEAMFVYGGQVGIGAASPDARLYVSGDFKATGVIYGPNGDASNPAYTFTSDTDTGMFRAASDSLAFTAGGTKTLVVNSGNVGIGTSSVDTTLEVNGANMSNTFVNKSFYSNTSGANVTINWNNGNKQKITLAHNVTFAFTDPSAGVGSFSLKITQDGTGSRTVTWPASVKWPGGVAPTLSTAPGYIDIVTCIYDSGPVYYCQIGLDFR